MMTEQCPVLADDEYRDDIETHGTGHGSALRKVHRGDTLVARTPLGGDRILRETEGRAKVRLLDFHAEATSEKLAMAWYLDGRLSALWGTHTHVQTADARVFPQGTGYITDLGMTGPRDSVLGIAPEQSVRMFLGYPRDKYTTAPGPVKLEGAVFTVDTDTGRCLEVRPVRLEE